MTMVRKNSVRTAGKYSFVQVAIRVVERSRAGHFHQRCSPQYGLSALGKHRSIATIRRVGG